MNSKIFRIALTAALSGFLFGFDTVVISGANLPIKELWNTSPWFHGTFIMSMALWGTVVGSLFGGIPCDKFGRKKTLFWIGILYAASALGSALATDPYIFSFFRFCTMLCSPICATHSQSTGQAFAILRIPQPKHFISCKPSLARRIACVGVLHL